MPSAIPSVLLDVINLDGLVAPRQAQLVDAAMFGSRLSMGGCVVGVRNPFGFMLVKKRVMLLGIIDVELVETPVCVRIVYLVSW